MDKYTRVSGTVAPLDRSNVDTDAIIPKQFLKSIQRTGFGPYLFDEWRYRDHGEPGMDCSRRPLNQDFILNREPYRNATILLTRANFGCGSSREHAPWALLDYGLRTIIAASFADIFYNNCFKNGILPIVLDPATIEQLFAAVARNPGYRMTVDLEQQQISTCDHTTISFDIDPYRKSNLLNGLDEIGQTLRHAAEIGEFEDRHRAANSWLFKPVVLE
ncbi:MAG: 3-isopropylmalate dehydratase small subunit [Candidatus Neomarinimicrobiota bacterium]